jgi:hypothetical protein
LPREQIGLWNAECEKTPYFNAIPQAARKNDVSLARGLPNDTLGDADPPAVVLGSFDRGARRISSPFFVLCGYRLADNKKAAT